MSSATGAVAWKKIAEARKDGVLYLLWFPRSTLPPAIASTVDAGLAVYGWYFSSPKGTDNGWETPFGSIGEPTHFAGLSAPQDE